MENVNLDDRLKHLSPEEIESLVNDYYSEITVAELVNKYNINIDSSKLFSILPPIKRADLICPYCNIAMYEARLSKTAQKLRYLNSDISCYKCGHIVKGKCKCVECKNKIEELKEERLDYIKEHYDLDKKSKILLKDISMKDRLYLGAFARNCLSEDLLIIKNLNSKWSTISPNQDYTRKMLKELVDKNILLISPNSNPDSFIVPYIDYKINEINGVENSYDEDYSGYYIWDVDYYINISCDDGELLQNILFPNIDINVYCDDLEELWLEVATEECLRYLSIKASSMTKSFKIGEITRTSIRKMLETQSVSQIYSIIYKAHASISSGILEKRIPKERAATMIIGRCMEYYERALINNWQLSSYNRVKDCPETDVSYFLFYRMIKINEQGFYSKPSLSE